MHRHASNMCPLSLGQNILHSLGYTIETVRKCYGGISRMAVITYRKDDMKIQIIVSKVPVSYMVQSFDLSFLSSLYYVMEGVPVIKVFSPCSILNRRCLYEERCLVRLRLQINRLCRIIGASPGKYKQILSLLRSVDQCFRRLDKYYDRGFNLCEDDASFHTYHRHTEVLFPPI
jgi:hypothetical protein